MLKQRLLLGVVAVATAAVPMLANRSGPAPAGADQEPGLFSDELVEVAAPIVVEAVPTTSDGRPTLIAGPDHQVDPEIQKEMENHAAELRAELTEAGGPNPTSTFGAASGGITVSYNPSHPAPTSVRTVVDDAAQLWSSALALHPQGPIVIDVSWQNLGNPGLLGYAGPDGMYFGGDLPPGKLYPAALTNTLLGLDANGASRAEVTVVLNSQLLDNDRWHLAVSGAVPTGKIDLYSVVLHEVGHGLGFLGSATVGSNGQPRLHTTPYTFDEQASWATTPLVSLSDADAGSALRSGDVHIQVSEAEKFELYAPGSWISGSSYSHFDEHQYPGGSAGALMTPMLGNGESARILDAAVLGVMDQIGWPMATAAVTPAIESIVPALTSATVSWDRQLWKYGLAPDQYRVEAWRGSNLEQTVTVTGTSSSASVGSLSPATSYTVRVVPIANGVDGVKAVASVTTAEGGEPADPSEWPSYIQDNPLHGEVNRLYQAYFLRLPDQSGFDYWLSQRIGGQSAAQISAAFAGSTEFSQRYGSLSNQAFVDLVYANVLNRAGDPEGRAFWIQRLNDGLSRGEVMLGFAESSEYVGRTQTTAAMATDEARITRLYRAFFGRSPDAPGLNHWSGLHANGATLEAIAGFFVASNEFAATYGSLTDEQFVDLVYQNVLQRNPDLGGRSFWVEALRAGSNRGEVMVQFSESAEFIRRTGTTP